MPASTLQSKVDAAWKTIDSSVSTAIGMPDDRPIPRIAVVQQVPASTRVHVVDLKPPTPTTRDGAYVTKYDATVVRLSHRRFQRDLYEDDLTELADDDAKAKRSFLA